MTKFSDIYLMMGISSPFKEQLKTPDGVRVYPSNIIFRNNLPCIVDPDTGIEYLATIHIKNNKGLSLGDFDGLMGMFGLEGFSDSKRIHLKRCRTIRRMIEQREFFKYHASVSPNHNRLVLARDGEAGRPLKVCWNCIRELNLSPSLGFRPNQFDFSKFLSDFESILKRDMKTEFDAADDYPPDWPEISAREKRLANYVCECCGINLSTRPEMLDVHHKNKIKADNASENLVVLCSNCHKMQPYHGHMGEPSEELRTLRVRQGLKTLCPNCGG